MVEMAASASELRPHGGASFAHLMALGMWMVSSALTSWWNLGQKQSYGDGRLSNDTTSEIRGESVHDGEDVVDGSGESRDHGSDHENAPSEQSGLSGEGPQASNVQSSSLPTESFNDTQVEGKEEDQPQQQNNDDLIRKGREIFLQAFNWESHKYQWWQLLRDKVPQVAAWGFTSMWLPPVFDSLAPEGYLPRDLYSLNTVYGSESELRNLLQTMQKCDLRAMADIVINHRIGSTQGIRGMYNRYDGMPMPWDEHAVTCDTGGLGNPSTGAIFEGAPNIDHTQEFVRNDLKNWMRWLRKDVGFSDFRFDFAKGYSARFVKEYIETAEPRFSIGEYWDSCNYVGTDYVLDYNQDSHRQRIVDWIDGSGALGGAFDFTTKAILQEAVLKKEWWRLRDPQGRPSGVMGMWLSRSVTFIDNHDTGSTQAHWPFPREHVMQGYAYILTHPGQPCVFYDHMYEWGDDTRNAILDLIAIRKWQDIHSRSPVEILEANSSVYAAHIDGKLCMKLGDGDWSPQGESWELATSGWSYAVWQKSQHLLPS